jgi:ferrous iron transport protein A
MTISDLIKGDKAVITNFIVDNIPLKLIEMGCIEGNSVELVQNAPLKDPLYLNVNGTFLAIRKETASQISVEKI